jgi:hypothetical protein
VSHPGFTPRRILLSVVCLSFSGIAALSQTAPTFKTSSTDSTVRQARNAYAVDVNNDGVLDIVQDTIQLPNQVNIRVANGNGTFRNGFSYTFPLQYQSTTLMASGDLNGDGKVDLVFGMAGFPQIAVFLGNGDGTFQNPRYQTIAFPSGEWIGGSPLVLADFNHDGKLDLATEANTSSISQLFALPGNGDGTFGAPHLIHTAAANTGTGYQIATGDFDLDGKADLAYTDTSNCVPGNCHTVLHVAYGNGDLTFSDTTPFTSTDLFTFSTGDLNGDGRTDIFGTQQPVSHRQAFLYASGTRSFTLYTAPQAFTTNVAMADFNGDGLMDLTGFYSGQLVVLAATANPGVFTRYAYTTPTYQQNTDPVVGDFNRDTRPDVFASAQLAQTAGGPTVPNSEIFTAINTTASGNWGGCNYPAKGQGIGLCLPTSTTTSPVRFNASANSFGLLRKIELWVDGKKIAEQHHAWEQRAWFDLTSTFAAGSHSGVLYAADVDNRLQKLAFAFTVGSSGTCAAPSTPGVNVCTPANGSTVTSPVQVQAAANITGTLARMEVWVDGVKKFTESTSKSFTTSITLAAGSHRFDVYAVNTAGTKWLKTVTATVH